MVERNKITDINKVPALMRRVRELGGARIKIGIIGNSELALIAIVQELGTDKAGPNHDTTIPERSTFRAVADSRKAKAKALADAADVIDLKQPLKKSLDVIGIRYSELLREKYRSNVSPRNKPSTIAAKGSARTLIDTGGLVDEVKHEVV